MRKMKRLLTLAICCTSATALMFGVKADSYIDKYSTVASWSNAAGYTMRYYGTAQYNETQKKFSSSGSLKSCSGGSATITTSGSTNNGSSIVIRGNIAAPNDYTNSVTRTVYSTSSNVKPQ